MGGFWPGYAKPQFVSPLLDTLPSPNLQFVDHVVGNQPDLEMENVAKWCEMQNFWKLC